MRNPFSFFSRKQAVPQSQILIYDPHSNPESQRHYKAFSDEAYRKNVIAYRCINLIAGAMASIDWQVYKKQGAKKRKQVETHPVLDLLARPGKLVSGNTFERNFVSYLMISGNSFVVAFGPKEGAPPMQLDLLRPDLVKVVPGAGGMPARYEYTVNQKTTEFPVAKNGNSSIMHSKLFNPLDQWSGMSPIEAATYSVDTLNHAGRWNLSLLMNGARPGFAIEMKTDDRSDGMLTPDQREQLRRDIDKHISGSKNVGRPMVLEGGMKYTPLGDFSPKDMDFLNSKKTSEKDVALAFGVPGQMVGVEGSQTFANWEQARLALYEDTILPMKRTFRDELNAWLLPTYGDTALILDIDEDSIDAMAPRRAERWAKAKDASWATENEKREITGLGKYEPGESPADRIFIPLNVQPIEFAVQEPEPPPPLTDTEDVTGPQDEAEPAPKAPVPEKSTAPLEVKAVNLETKGQRELFWKAHDRRMRAFEKGLARKLVVLFKAEKATVQAAVHNIKDKNLAEFAMHEAVSKSTKNFSHVLKVQLTEVMKTFGREVFQLRKGTDAAPETKDAADSRFDFSISIFVDAQVKETITKVSGTTARRLKKRLDDAFKEFSLSEDPSVQLSFSDAVGAGYDAWSESRSDTISRTEVHAAATEGQRAAAKALNLQHLKKEWVGIKDNRIRDTHADIDGTIIDFEEKFQVSTAQGGVDSMEGPGDKNASLENLINCRCAMTFSTGDGIDVVDEGDNE